MLVMKHQKEKVGFKIRCFRCGFFNYAISTLGWPNNLDKRYFPNDVLVTAYDIIFFWVCRMVFQSIEFTHERPFKEVLIHGLIRDKIGRK